MSGGYEWDSGAACIDDGEESRPVSRASSPAIPRLTSTLLVPTTIPNARSSELVRPMRPARGTRPLLPSSVSTRASVMSTMRDRSHAVMPSDGVVHDPNNEAPAARRSSLAIAGSRRGLPSSLSQRSHVFASIRDRSRDESSENRTPEE